MTDVFVCVWEIQANHQNRAQCVVVVGEWCSSRRLQSNPDKTELIWFGSRTNIERLQQEDTSLQIGSTITSIRVHVGKVASECFYHLRCLCQLHFILTWPMMQRLASAFILSQLDYCNTVLAGLPAITLAPLQRVVNAAVRLVAGLGWHDHVTPAMRELHWLPVVYCIKYKLCISMQASVNDRCPEYISEVLVATPRLPGRSLLRSVSSGAYDVPRTKTEFSKSAFSVAGQKMWNELPIHLR